MDTSKELYAVLYEWQDAGTFGADVIKVFGTSKDATDYLHKYLIEQYDWAESFDDLKPYFISDEGYYDSFEHSDDEVCERFMVIAVELMT